MKNSRVLAISFSKKLSPKKWESRIPNIISDNLFKHIF